jgi:glycosyltransferase involved in cell wall biosynthesis
MPHAAGRPAFVSAPTQNRHPSPRVGVLVVAYNAESTLAATLSRLPESFVERVDHVLVCDDASTDATYDVGLRFQSGSTLPMTVVKHQENLGYGGNQKAGYEWAIEHGLDIVVLLHGDGQYAPECIEDLVAPLEVGQADAVFGSRMMVKGGARAGGMPAYKLVGNKILTTFQNWATGLDLSEWHSGYRAYRIDALAELDLAEYSDGFDFDTEIILGLAARGLRITEVPIPTYYGDEICYVNGLQYARDVTRDVIRYRMQRIGFGGPGALSETDPYELKTAPYSSHGVLLDWTAGRTPGRVLDVGCSDGVFAQQLRQQGHHVVGTDVTKHDGVADRVDEFVEADLNLGLPEGVGSGFDVIVAADVLEHVMDPERLLADLLSALAPDGEIVVSIPNFGHWYPRGRVALGQFDYDQRGPLDHGHVRFFTRKSFERMLGRLPVRIAGRQVVGSPIEVLGRGHSHPSGRLLRAAGSADRAATRFWPTLFGYQFLYRLERA